MQDWINGLRPFTTFHLVVVVACALGIWAVVLMGRAARRRGALVGVDGEAADHGLRLWLGWSAVAVQAAALVWRPMVTGWDVQESFPLQLCRVTGWVAAIGMMSGGRVWKALNFYWSLGLSSQALVTPVYGGGLGDVGFWLFWVAHGQIVGAGVYELAVRGYRPRWGDAWVAMGLGLVYAGVVIGVNFVWSLDYAYLGPGLRTPGLYEGHHMAAWLERATGSVWLRIAGVVMASLVWMGLMQAVVEGVSAVRALWAQGGRAGRGPLGGGS